MSTRSRWGHVFDKLNTGLLWLNGVLILGNMVFVTSDIISRNVLAFPLPYLDEFSGYSMVYMCFLGAAWVLKREGHVSVDIVIDHLSPRGRTVQAIVVSIVLAATCLFFAYYGFGATYDAFARGKYLDIGIDVPVSPILLVMPLGYVLLFIQFIRRIMGLWRFGADVYKRAAKEEEVEAIGRV